MRQEAESFRVKLATTEESLTADHAREVAQLERPKIGADAPSDAAIGNLGKLHRRAADITDKTVTAGPAQQHALRREPRLFLAADHPDSQPGLAKHVLAELFAILGLSHRRCCHR